MMMREHEPMEATGGYIECSCGWPSKEQWDAGEPYARHVMLEARQDVLHDVADKLWGEPMGGKLTPRLIALGLHLRAELEEDDFIAPIDPPPAPKPRAGPSMGAVREFMKAVEDGRGRE